MCFTFEGGFEESWLHVGHNCILWRLKVPAAVKSQCCKRWTIIRLEFNHCLAKYLVLLRVDWCDPSIWRCPLKGCWCYWFLEMRWWQLSDSNRVTSEISQFSDMLELFGDRLNSLLTAELLRQLQWRCLYWKVDYDVGVFDADDDLLYRFVWL